jgi:hypothetical protein
MVDGFHIHIQTRMMKPLAIALNGTGMGLGGGEDGGGNVTNVQHKPVWNCHNESFLSSKHILIKMGKKKKKQS